MIQHHPRAVALTIMAVLLTGCAAPASTDRVSSAPRYSWSYVHTVLPPFWWFDLVDVPAARAKAGTGAGSTVAIVGTGVLKGHEDLPSMVAGESTCGSPPSDTDDYNGHGTQLAGIVAGRDPGHATRGVAPGAAVIPIKVDCGVVSAASLMKGVDAAIARKPDVILIAIGGYPSGPPDVFNELRDRVTNNRGILFVIASAWDGTHYPFPDWTTTDNALLVAAMTLDADERDRTRVRRDKEIQYSARRGTIWAPGRGVATAGIEKDPGSTNHSQFLMHGTSPAAAIVAGCAALVKTKSKPGTGGAALKEALLRGAEPKSDLGPVPDNKRLNCAAAIP